MAIFDINCDARFRIKTQQKILAPISNGFLTDIIDHVVPVFILESNDIIYIYQLISNIIHTYCNNQI